MRYRVIGAAVLLVGCGSGDGSVTVNSGDITATARNGAPPVVTAPDGVGGPMTATGQGSEWPANIAAIAPPYPGATIQTVIQGVVQGGGATVQFTTPDPADKVLAFYKAKAAAAGMTEVTNSTMGDRVSWLGRAGTGPRLGITTNPIDGGLTSGNLVVGLTSPTE